MIKQFLLVSLGKATRTASKNSVANHYSPCLEHTSPLASQALSWEAVPDSCRFWPRGKRRTCTRAGAPGRWGGFGVS